jgi:hypothetical protein
MGKTAVVNFIKSLGLSVETENRSILEGQEIDILIRDKNIAIEYCDLYGHSESKKPKDYNHTKHVTCKEKGIQLITIFEDEWLERQDQIKNILRAKLGLLPKIYARKTSLVVLEKKAAIDFLNKNHLQGSCNFLLTLGLELEGQIVGCATLSKHHRPNRNEAVLSRVCFADWAVVGGTSKLFEGLIIEAKKLGFSFLVSWSDNRWSDGGVYEKLGMTPEKLPPDYSYVKEGSKKRLSKQSCQKKNLAKKGGIGNTELEMAKSLGFSRIWDCGKIRWFTSL